MAAKQRVAYKALAQAKEMLNRVQERLANTHGEPAKRGPGHLPKAVVSTESVRWPTP